MPPVKDSSHSNLQKVIQFLPNIYTLKMQGAYQSYIPPLPSNTVTHMKPGPYMKIYTLATDCLNWYIPIVSITQPTHYSQKMGFDTIILVMSSMYPFIKYDSSALQHM